MSIEDFYISIFVDPEDQAEVFQRIAKRLARPVSDISINVNVLSNGSQRYSFSELPEIIQEFAPRLSEIEDIRIDYGIGQEPEYECIYYLVWSGTSLQTGMDDMTLYQAPIRLHIEGRYLHAKHITRPELYPQSMPETIALFLDVCGLSGPLENKIRHAAFSFSYLLQLAELARVLYHRDVREFACDLMRTFVFMQWGIPLSALLRYTGELSHLTEERVRQTWYTVPIREFYRVRDEVLQAPEKQRYEAKVLEIQHPYGMRVYQYALASYQFRERITLERIQRVLELPAERIRALILEACEKEVDLVCYDYGERGLLVAFDLDTYLWTRDLYDISSLYKIYNRLLDEVSD